VTRLSPGSFTVQIENAGLKKYRMTLWQIHPLTKIEVFQNGGWVDLDQLP
jgi:hypothetical protein